MKNLTYKIISLGAIIWATTFSSVGQTLKYAIDPGHTSVQTEVMRFEVVPVIGRFTDVSGVMEFDPEAIEKTTAKLNIKVDSYTANSIGGEEAVTSVAFLDAANYPEIIFELNSLTKTSDGHIANGTLEIHGTIKEIEVPVTIYGPDIDLPTRKQSIGITGGLTIDRTAYGAGKSMQLPNGRVLVSNDVKISFAILGIAE